MPRFAEGTTGGDTDAYCGKCRLTLAHVVIATDAGRPVRVQCKTCNAEHAMRAGTPARASATEAKPKRASKTAKPKQGAAERRAEAAFEAARAGKDLSRATRYTPRQEFSAGEVLDHATFGLGVVEKCLADNKVQVIFQTGGERVLVHAR